MAKQKKSNNIQDAHDLQDHEHDESCQHDHITGDQPVDEEGFELFIPPEALEESNRQKNTINKSELLEVGHREFINFFPKVQLPQTLNEESIHTFNQHNRPFTIGAEITFLRDEGDDEFTEYLPCFRLKNPEGINVLIYWRAGLLDQHYYVMTMDNKGKIIAKAPIAGIRSDGEKVARLYAFFDNDWTIHLAAGEIQVGKEDEYNPENTKAFEAEILPDGQILFEESENLF